MHIFKFKKITVDLLTYAGISQIQMEYLRIIFSESSTSQSNCANKDWKGWQHEEKSYRVPILNDKVIEICYNFLELKTDI